MMPDQFASSSRCDVNECMFVIACIHIELARLGPMMFATDIAGGTAKLSLAAVANFVASLALMMDRNAPIRRRVPLAN